MKDINEAAKGAEQTQKALQQFLDYQSMLPKDSNLWEHYNEITQRLFADLATLQVHPCLPAALLSGMPDLIICIQERGTVVHALQHGSTCPWQQYSESTQRHLANGMVALQVSASTANLYDSCPSWVCLHRGTAYCFNAAHVSVDDAFQIDDVY